MDNVIPKWLVRVRQAAAILGALAAIAIVFWPRPVVQHRKDRIPVRFWHMWTAEWEVVVRGIADDFNKSQDKYEVIPLSVPDSADSKFLLAVTGGDPPDVMAQWNPVIPTWADGNLLRPMDDLMGPELLARFRRDAYPVAVRIGSYKNHVYGITIGINDFAIYYRPSQFKAAGLDPNRFPTTLEELDSAADRLNQFDKNGNLTRMGFLPSGLFGIARSFHGGFYDWNTGKVTLNTPGNVRALRYLVSRRKRLGYENVVRYEAGLDTRSFAGGWPFMNGGYSATIDGQWRVEQVRKYAPNLDYMTAPIPPPRGGIPMAGLGEGNFMIIPKGAKQVEGAWEFIKFWSGLEKPERAAEYYTRGGWLPLWPAVANAPKYREYVRKNPQYATFLKILASPYLEPPPPVPYQVFLMDHIARAEDFAVRGILSPEEAMQHLDKEVRDELARRRKLGFKDG
ncbi:MAG TPA: extracellular solute-binding protein [Armatimonadota bacterium]